MNTSFLCTSPLEARLSHVCPTVTLGTSVDPISTYETTIQLTAPKMGSIEDDETDTSQVAGEGVHFQNVTANVVPDGE